MKNLTLALASGILFLSVVSIAQANVIVSQTDDSNYCTGPDAAAGWRNCFTIASTSQQASIILGQGASFDPQHQGIKSVTIAKDPGTTPWFITFVCYTDASLTQACNNWTFANSWNGGDRARAFEQATSTVDNKHWTAYFTDPNHERNIDGSYPLLFNPSFYYVLVINDLGDSVGAYGSPAGVPYFVLANDAGPAITSLSVSSDAASSTLAKAGTQVSVSFAVDTVAAGVQASIGGHTASISTTTPQSFKASAVLDGTEGQGPVSFAVSVVTPDALESYQYSTTTDHSSVYLDNTPPVITVDSRVTNELNPLLGGTATDTPSGIKSVVATIGAQVYAAATTTTSWSATFPGLAEGVYTVTALATDNAGNQTSSTGVLTIDRTPPALTITAGPAQGSFTNLTTASFSFTSDAPTLCSLDGGVLTTCTSPYSVSALSSGTHLFTVSASDNAGNTSSLSRSWSVDTAAPILKEVAIATTTSDTSPTYVFSSSKAGTISYGGACTSTSTLAMQGDNTIVFSPLAVGTYSNCTVTVADAVGNISNPLLVSTFIITAVVEPPHQPKNKDECKNGGWRSFTDPKFKNQGDCVSFTVSHKYKDDGKKDDDKGDDDHH